MYKIKPLEWDKKELESLKQHFGIATASTPFGEYTIIKQDGNIKWDYCFDEYYDEEQFSVTSIEQAKKEAEEHWQNRIKECLIEV